MDGKNCLDFSGGRGEDDHLIEEEGITDRNCSIEEKLAWEVEKTRKAGANREFGKE